MTQDVIIQHENGIGRITLNRPDALHALNHPMCSAIRTALLDWRDNPDIHLAMIDHAHDTRGFCAGGDIAMLRESGMSDGRAARVFFAEEYRVNALIKSFPKPFVAIMDGVTMGGGVGLSVHGSHRIATERTLFAMPEAGIGLFPDVGGGWFLPRLRGELGTWLALSGARLKGFDVAAAGIATHVLPSELVGNLKAQILSADFSHNASELLGAILSSLTHTIPAGSFEANCAEIDDCFKGDRVEDMLAALEAGSEWAQKQAGFIRTKSPETLKVALRQLREGARCATFEDNMRMEYRIGWRKVQSPDFIEGVRAVIIDKDHAPNWSPARLEDVTDEYVDTFFEELGDNDLSFT